MNVDLWKLGSTYLHDSQEVSGVFIAAIAIPPILNSFWKWSRLWYNIGDIENCCSKEEMVTGCTQLLDIPKAQSKSCQILKPKFLDSSICLRLWIIPYVCSWFLVPNYKQSKSSLAPRNCRKKTKMRCKNWVGLCWVDSWASPHGGVVWQQILFISKRSIGKRPFYVQWCLT